MHFAACLNSLAVRMSVGILGCVLSLAAEAAAQDLPSDARAVLDRFTGTWTTQAQIRHSGPPPRTIDTRGRAACQPTLGGRYFEFRTETVPAGDSDLQIMTFDEQAGVFRQWVFSSDGYYHEAEGTWDASTSVLRWTGQSGSASFVIDDHWVSADRLEWTLRRTDKQGKLLQTIQGTVTRAGQR
jgi:hypothetical protein